MDLWPEPCRVAVAGTGRGAHLGSKLNSITSLCFVSGQSKSRSLGPASAPSERGEWDSKEARPPRASGQYREAVCVCVCV